MSYNNPLLEAMVVETTNLLVLRHASVFAAQLRPKLLLPTTLHCSQSDHKFTTTRWWYHVVIFWGYF
jgi:hypothetical protein